MPANKGKGKSKPLPHKYLDQEEEAKILREIDRSNDRAVAIVGGSLVENYLALALLTRLRQLDNAEQKELFGLESSLLATFHAKIQLGYALNLYSGSVLSDLRTVKRIRNMFAHQLEISTFNHPEVITETLKLIFPKWAKSDDGWSTSANSDFSKSRICYERTVAHLASRFALEATLAHPPGEVALPSYDLWSPA